MIAQEASRRLDLFDKSAKSQTHDMKARVTADGREHYCGRGYQHNGAAAPLAVPSLAAITMSLFNSGGCLWPGVGIGATMPSERANAAATVMEFDRVLAIACLPTLKGAQD